MDNSANGTQLPPIKVIRSDETQGQVDTTSVEFLLKCKNLDDSKDLARFAIHHSVRRTLPYGMWTCFDGRQVLFNREYQPILDKKNGKTGYCDHNEWIDNATIETTQYFYNDVTAPMRYLVKHLGGETLDARGAKDCKKALHICLQFLKDFTPKESSSVNSRYSVAS